MNVNIAADLDDLDRRILDLIQSDFPLESRPYALLGEKLGISEKDCLTRVRKMRQNGLIRRLGANFQSNKVGFVSTLCAAKVPETHKKEFIEKVNELKGVTHNYERDHPYNIWFTLISESRETAAELLETLRRDTGLEILNLPATKLYKIKVDFPMG